MSAENTGDEIVTCEEHCPPCGRQPDEISGWMLSLLSEGNDVDG